MASLMLRPQSQEDMVVTPPLPSFFHKKGTNLEVPDVNQEAISPPCRATPSCVVTSVLTPYFTDVILRLGSLVRGLPVAEELSLPQSRVLVLPSTT